MLCGTGTGCWAEGVEGGTLPGVLGVDVVVRRGTVDVVGVGTEVCVGSKFGGTVMEAVREGIVDVAVGGGGAGGVTDVIGICVPRGDIGVVRGDGIVEVGVVDVAGGVEVAGVVDLIGVANAVPLGVVGVEAVAVAVGAEGVVVIGAVDGGMVGVGVVDLGIVVGVEGLEESVWVASL